MNKFLFLLFVINVIYFDKIYSLEIINYNNNKNVKTSLNMKYFNFTPLEKIENSEYYEKKEKEKKLKDFQKKLEINLFGYTHHFHNYFDEKTMDIKAPDDSTNVGIGINYYFYKNYFLTLNMLKNCVNFSDYIIGIGYSFKNIVNYNFLKNKIDFLLGIMYYKTKYLKEEKSIVPFYFLRYNFNKKVSLNLSYIPAIFSPTNRDDFLFFALTFKY